AGADTVNGNDGNDILHGHSLTGSQIRTILNANPNVVYNDYTNSFYQFVGTSSDYTTAATSASGSILSGLNGHLANITSAIENEFVYQLGVTNGASFADRTWLGASDTISSDDEFFWTSGIEAGVQFSSGSTPISSSYTNWSVGQPNDFGGSQEHITIRYNGGADDDTWDDTEASNTNFYVIEWDVGLINDDNAIDTLNGGAGNDTIYGYGGDDILNGGADNDILLGGAGNDNLTGGTGNDSLYGNDGNDILNGNDGNDILDAGGGNDTVNGGNNDDVIYGDGAVSLRAEIDSILAANPGVVYSNDTGNFYQVITTNANYTTARANAIATTINGVGGYLANVTSAAENAFIDSLIIADTWLGGTDAGTEGVWIWQDGPEGGDQFWAGDSSGSSVGGYYENWNGGEPNNSGDEDALEINTSGGWNDQGVGSSNDYIIEWNGSDLLSSSSSTDPAGDDIITGGAGDDTIYGDYISTGTGSQIGWFYQYYDLSVNPSTLATAGFTLDGGRNNTNTVNDSGLTTDTDPNNFDTGNNYALKFTTTLTITTGGTYTFQTRSDDGSMLFLDGVQIVDNDGLHGPVTVTSAGQALTAGTYTLEATFFERGGGQVMDITMSGPDTGGGFINIENYAGVSVDNVGALGEGDDSISGGAGLDTLYGGGGADNFIFEAASAFAETDVIMDFSSIDGDSIDISDIVTGFSGTITDYVQFIDSSGDTLVQVDGDGLTGGVSFQTIARIDGLTGLDEATYFANGNIIV
ncbi:MAG: PA14 domain-containing protein, partial [Pseudomonadota bacterium]